MDRERIVQLFFFVFLAAIAYELYELLLPFLFPIAWAMLIAFIFHPLMIGANRLVRRRSLAALLITLAVALGVILPALSLAGLLAGEAQSIYASIPGTLKDGGLKGIEDLLTHSRIAMSINTTLSRHGVDLEEQIPRIAMEGAKATSDVLVADLTGIARNLAHFIIDFGIMLITLFYLLRDGEDYYHSIRALTPLHEEDKRAVFETLGHTLSSVMRGLLVTALIQGVLIGVGFLVLGVPYWAFLAMATAACGLLPFGGTALVWIPAAGYLLYAFGWGKAIVLLIWGSTSVAVIDNFIKPFAMGQGAGLPTLALFFGLAGGLEAFGPIGLFTGPAIIAVFAALLRVYRKTYGTTRREAA